MAVPSCRIVLLVSFALSDKVKARFKLTEFSSERSMDSESQEYKHESDTDRPMEHSPRGRYIRVRIRFFGAIVSII